MCIEKLTEPLISYLLQVILCLWVFMCILRLLLALEKYLYGPRAPHDCASGQSCKCILHGIVCQWLVLCKIHLHDWPGVQPRDAPRPCKSFSFSLSQSLRRMLGVLVCLALFVSLSLLGLQTHLPTKNIYIKKQKHLVKNFFFVILLNHILNLIVI